VAAATNCRRQQRAQAGGLVRPVHDPVRFARVRDACHQPSAGVSATLHLMFHQQSPVVNVVVPVDAGQAKGCHRLVTGRAEQGQLQPWWAWRSTSAGSVPATTSHAAPQPSLPANPHECSCLGGRPVKAVQNSRIVSALTRPIPRLYGARGTEAAYLQRPLAEAGMQYSEPTRPT
jgi:hypothetical protein